MPAKLSAGLLLYRQDAAMDLEVLLVHPGGPYWSRRDEGAWSIPKGEVEPGEEPADVAERELAEEVGCPRPEGDRVDLGEIRQAGGKRVHAWAVRAEVDTSTATSNQFEMEWPPRSGRLQSFPEVDRVEWTALDLARRRMIPAQRGLLDRLAEVVARP